MAYSLVTPINPIGGCGQSTGPDKVVELALEPGNCSKLHELPPTSPLSRESDAKLSSRDLCRQSVRQQQSPEAGHVPPSKDVSSPALLHLHGGRPDCLLTEDDPTGLEDILTVVSWEQCGSGLSYGADIPRESLNVDQMISARLS